MQRGSTSEGPACVYRSKEKQKHKKYIPSDDTKTALHVCLFVSFLLFVHVSLSFLLSFPFLTHSLTFVHTGRFQFPFSFSLTLSHLYTTMAEEKKRMLHTELAIGVVKRVLACRGATHRDSLDAGPPLPRSMAAASKALSRSTFSIADSRLVRSFSC